MKVFPWTFPVLAVALTFSATHASAALIASDSFVTTAAGAGNTYVTGNLNGQTATTGTTGYFTGAAAGNQIAGWQSGTGAFNASTTGLTHPLVVNPPSTNDGSVVATGNANTRLQYRDFASATAPASNTYYYSLLLRESSNSYTGQTYAGVGLSRAAGGNASNPAEGFGVGFSNGALSIFADTGSSLQAGPMIPSPTPNATYMALITYTGGATPQLAITVYDSAGTPLATSFGPITPISPSELGAFELFVSSDFNAGSPATVNFDEFRFGTERSDVILAPEPASLGLLAFGALAFSRGRRRR
jgi:hypothetical protein